MRQSSYSAVKLAAISSPCPAGSVLELGSSQQGKVTEFQVLPRISRKCILFSHCQITMMQRSLRPRPNIRSGSMAQSHEWKDRFGAQFRQTKSPFSVNLLSLRASLRNKAHSLLPFASVRPLARSPRGEHNNIRSGK